MTVNDSAEPLAPSKIGKRDSVYRATLLIHHSTRSTEAGQ